MQREILDSQAFRGKRYRRSFLAALTVLGLVVFWSTLMAGALALMWGLQ